MANTLANLARMYTETTGTGTLTLTTAVPGFNTFADAGVASGSTITYAIYNGPHREIGQGVYTASGLTLTRGTVYSSTNGGAKISLTGRSEVFITPAAEDLASFSTDLTAHLNDTAGAHAASAISFSATGGISSTDVQAAIAELDSEKLAVASNLSDLASASTARTNLGLGTAAVQNTGTSGNNVPLLDGNNTWSGVQTVTTTAATAAFEVTSSASFAIPFSVVSTNADALGGPGFQFYRNSASPAANDDIGFFNFRGNDDLGAGVNYVQLVGTILDPTNTSKDSRLRVNVYTANTQETALTIKDGVFVGSPTGFAKGTGTLNAVTLYENGTSLASKYQGLDSELTAIAGLTSAADRLPYFTGSGTASLATFTTAGRNLVDDADASAQRTTLGLGSAATQATGTSGATLPFLNGSNTWSAQNIFSATTNISNILAISTDTSASAGPFISVRRSISGSDVAANDAIGVFNFQGVDSGGANTNYGQLQCDILDPADGSEDGQFSFNTVVAGTLTFRMKIAQGVWVGSPTGGDRGVGTLNAVAVYDDSVLLCAPVEYMKSGTVNTAMWDGYAIDVVEPEAVNDELVEIDVQLSEPEVQTVRQRDGTFKRVEITSKKATPLEAHPVLNDKGEQVGVEWVPQMVKKVTPAKTIKRKNELAHEFKAMLDEGFDPRDPKAYFDKMLADEALPGLKTKANWVPNEESNAKRTNRIILALELQTAAFKTVYEQVEALKAEVASLKKAKP